MIKIINFVLVTSAVAAMLLVVYMMILPNYMIGTSVSVGKGPSFNFPILEGPSNSDKTVDFKMFVPAFHATKFKLYSASCVTQLHVNRREVPRFGSANTCTTDTTAVIDLGSLLVSGENSVHFVLHPMGEWITFYIIPDIRDFFTITVMAVMMLYVCFVTWWFLVTFSVKNISFLEVGVFLSGCLLRILYSFSTAFFARGNDVCSGHVPFICYLSECWRLPPLHSQANEYFQPPLYYFLAAVSTALPKSLGISNNSLLQAWEAESCFLSILMLAGFWAVSWMLFKRDRVSRCYFFFCLAFYPIFIYNAGTINNDVLFNTLSSLWIILLVSVCKRSSLQKWLLLSVVLGLALLTKGNALLLILVSYLILFSTRQISHQAKSVLAVFMVSIIFVISGWFYIERAKVSTGPLNLMVHNLSTIGPEFHIVEDFWKLTTFDPVALFQYPYSAYNELCDPRRQYFWEFLFKSSFFGEGFFCIPLDPQYIGIARVIVTCAFLLLPLILFGYGGALLRRSKEAWPLLVMTPTILFSHWLYVMQAPFISSQNFRYSAILVIPFTYFLLRGLNKLPLVPRRIMQAVLLVLSASCGALMFSICLS